MQWTSITDARTHRHDQDGNAAFHPRKTAQGCGDEVVAEGTNHFRATANYLQDLEIQKTAQMIWTNKQGFKIKGNTGIKDFT